MICKRCACNAETYPRVLCRQEPFGEIVRGRLDCPHYITQEDNDRIMKIFPLIWSKKTWNKLSRDQQRRWIGAFSF